MKTEDQELVAAARGAAAVLCALHEIDTSGVNAVALTRHIADHQVEVRALLQFAFRKIGEDEGLR